MEKIMEREMKLGLHRGLEGLELSRGVRCWHNCGPFWSFISGGRTIMETERGAIQPTKLKFQ